MFDLLPGAQRVEVDGPPPLTDVPPPGKVQASRTIAGRFCLAGEGPIPSTLMIVGLTVSEDEIRTDLALGAARHIAVTPGVLRGAMGNIFKDLLGSFGLSRDHYFYTPLVRYLLPKAERSRPKATDVQWCLPSLLNDIERVQPKIIMCMGKPVFDVLSGIKLSQDEAQGGFFPCVQFPHILLYPSYDLFKLVTTPVTYERIRVDVLQIMQELEEFQAVGMNQLERVEREYQVIHNLEELRGVLDEMRAFKIFCLDCEWHGMQHVDGLLRSMQLSWRKGRGIYIRFMDDQLNYVFDASYEQVGAVLLEVLGRDDVRYIGHHLAADFPWIHHWLKLPIDQRGFLDTEFALQTLNEHADLSLERIAMAGTDLGRYDQELVLWKKANKLPKGDGYGRIPDDIMIPYAIKDVDAPMRLLPSLVEQLVRKNLWRYYTEIFNPFVTDVFTDFAINGLPMDVQKMDELRELYTFAKDEMNALFVRRMRASAEIMVMAWGGEDYASLLTAGFERLREDGDLEALAQSLRAIGDARSEKKRAEVLITHLVNCQDFNIRSTSHLRHWLFEVNEYVPIKTTGKPSISWERVLNRPEHQRKDFIPAVDKQTLQLLGQTYSDKDLYALLDLNAVGNVSKAFLKEPTLDEDGNLTKENGLHFWLASDGKIHGQFSATETGRPRAWRPNSLNWPSYVNKRISQGVAELFHLLQQEGRLPEKFQRYYKLVDGKPVSKVPSIRSCVTAPPGWCFVESDYATAEIRALAFRSGDENLIRLMTEPDPQFGLAPGAQHGDELPVRLFYAQDSGVRPEEQTLDYLFAYATKGVVKKRFNIEDLRRNADGTLAHPPHDLHWSLAEMTSGRPREALDKDEQRAGAKVGNFSSAYGASGAALERKIEADTGKKPPEGTGQALLDALARRQPVATKFLEDVAEVPKDPGFLIAASGRIRHFVLPMRAHGVSDRIYESAAAAQGREARNFLMQESVGATAARAAVRLRRHYKDNNMSGSVAAVLYDSVLSLCRLEERFEVAKLHQRFMVDENTWEYHGRELKYPIDTKFVISWSTSPPTEMQNNLNDPNWNVQNP
jgi:uracil-DNA glycosylase family 4